MREQLLFGSFEELFEKQERTFDFLCGHGRGRA
jgi:hypothetical protein